MIKRYLHRNILIIMVSLMVAMTACSLTDRMTMGVKIRQAQRLWEETAAGDYKITVLEVRSIWSAQTHNITVKSGQVVESSAFCTKAPMEFETCNVKEFEPEDFTVPGLFTKAREQAQSKYNRWTEIAFDENYGYPQKIAYDHPDIMDEDWVWRVLDFQVLE